MDDGSDGCMMMDLMYDDGSDVWWWIWYMMMDLMYDGAYILLGVNAWQETSIYKPLLS